MNDFRHFELKLPTVVLEIHEGRDTSQVSVVFVSFGIVLFFFCFYNWAFFFFVKKKYKAYI